MMHPEFDAVICARASLISLLGSLISLLGSFQRLPQVVTNVLAATAVALLLTLRQGLRFTRVTLFLLHLAAEARGVLPS